MQVAPSYLARVARMHRGTALQRDPLQSSSEGRILLMRHTQQNFLVVRDNRVTSV